MEPKVRHAAMNQKERLFAVPAPPRTMPTELERERDAEFVRFDDSLEEAEAFIASREERSGWVGRGDCL